MFRPFFVPIVDGSTPSSQEQASGFARTGSCLMAKVFGPAIASAY